MSRTGPALSGSGNRSRGPVPTSGQMFGTEMKHLRLRVKKLLCDSLKGMRITETILAPAKCIPDRDMGPLEGTEVGSWSVGLWSNPRVRSAIDRGETAQWDGREETVVGNACEGKPGSQGGKAILLNHA